MGEAARPTRQLTLLDVTAIAVNGIIGSGIFRLAGPLGLKAGPASVLGILACGGLCVLLGLCFAELTGMFDQNGGPFIYARAAFGTAVGFAVGWLCLFNAVLGYAVVAVGFGDELATLLPSLEAPLLFGLKAKTAVALAVIAAPAVVNVLGVKAGARTTDVLTGAKLLPLLLLAGVGLFNLHPEALMAAGGPSARAQPLVPRIASAAFMSVFLFSGFEFATVPSGEVKDARRTVGVAIVAALIACAGLYGLLQAATLSQVTVAQLPGSPLVDAAVALLGPWAARLLQLAALVSMAGFCAGSALVAPRYFSAMAQAGHVPAGLARLTRFGTPGPAIVCCALCAAGLALWMGFGPLVDLTNVTMLSQYIACTVAVIVLRYRQPDAPRRFRLPAGPLLPLLAAGVSVALLIQARPEGPELLVALGVVAAGFGVWALTLVAARMKWGQATFRP